MQLLFETFRCYEYSRICSRILNGNRFCYSRWQSFCRGATTRTSAQEVIRDDGG